MFQGTVAFTLDGQSFCVSGDWYGSKKRAQRDAGDKALAALRNQGAPVPPPPQQSPAASPMASNQSPAGIDGPIAELHCFVREESGLSSNQKVLTWEYESQTDMSALGKGAPVFRAIVSFQLRGTPCRFEGYWQQSKKKAQKDCASRVLRYYKGSETLDYSSASGSVSPMRSPARASFGMPPMWGPPATMAMAMRRPYLDPMALAMALGASAHMQQYEYNEYADPAWTAAEHRAKMPISLADQLGVPH
mmetsp:Transcript_103886/g.237837  ORF Transcript_103886/g.237837 Transcript_103886/m.237837 type:complete len:248 (+) Transcript_103886:160-903(+)